MKRLNYLTLISVVSCVSVVFLHTNNCFWTYSTGRYWKTANIIESFFYFAVPCFYMISGATLLDYREKYTLKEYFKKRITKTVIPFIFWSLFGILYGIYVLENVKVENLNFPYIYNGIMNTTFVSIYWFFPSLFCLYLSIPLFAAVDKNARKEVFSYLAIAGFIINFVIVLLKNTALSKYSLSWPLSVGVVSGALIYIVIGYLLSHYELTKEQRTWIYVAALAGFLIHSIGTYVVSTNAGKVLRTYKGYNSAPCIMYSVGIFVWLKYNGEKLMNVKWISKLVSWISPYTFGIYLIQMFIYRSMIKYLNITVTSIIYRLGAPFIIIPVAICLCWLMKKIPVLKHFVP